MSTGTAPPSASHRAKTLSTDTVTVPDAGSSCSPQPGRMPWLRAGAAGLGLTLTGAQIEAFERYRDELIAANTRINLTAITDPGDIEIKHFVDSLTCVLAWPDRARRRLRIVDVGTGAGFPGLPLKLADPDLTLTLVESIRKKAAFVADVVQLLGFSGVQHYAERAEVLGHQPEHRGRYDVAVARAVAPLAVLLEYALPLLRVGGRLIAQKTLSSARNEIGQSERALVRLGGSTPQPVPVTFDEQHSSEDGATRADSWLAEVRQRLAQRVLIVIVKEKPTPPAYPRRPGIPAKRPL